MPNPSPGPEAKARERKVKEKTPRVKNKEPAARQAGEADVTPGDK